MVEDECMSSEQQRQREQSPESTSALTFGPQADQEMERDVDLPVARKRTLESMQKTLVVRGLHPGVPGVLEATNLSLNARGDAELPFGRGGILMESPRFPLETRPGWTGWETRPGETIDLQQKAILEEIRSIEEKG